jgi:CubicO group peptidase (beta-lactamase class C family)
MSTSSKRIKRIFASLRQPQDLRGDAPGLRTLKSRMASHHTPGVSIAVIHNHTLDWAGGVGMADVRSGAPTRINTLFQAGSMCSVSPSPT